MDLRRLLRVARNPAMGAVLKFSVSIGIVAACFAVLDVSSLPEVFRRIEPVWLGVAFLLSVAGTIILPAMVTQRALQIERLSLSLHQLVVINFATRFYVLILPRAASIGIRWLRYRQGGSGHDALALMVYERLVQLFAMMCVALAALSMEYRSLGVGAAPLFLVTATAVLFVGAALTPFVFPVTTPWWQALARLSDRFAPAFVSRRINKLLDAVQAFQRLETKTSVYIVLLSLVAYSLFILSPYVLVMAMDLEISLTALAWIRPLVFVMTLLPFTVGGLGVREIGFVSFLHLYGIAHYQALALSLALFGIQVMIGAIGAIAELWRYAIRPALLERNPKKT